MRHPVDGPLPVDELDQFRDPLVVLLLVGGVAWLSSGSPDAPDEVETIDTEPEVPLQVEASETVEVVEAVDPEPEVVEVAEASEVMDVVRPSSMRTTMRATMQTTTTMQSTMVAETTVDTAMEPEVVMVVAAMESMTTAAQDRARATELTGEGNRLSLQGRLPAAIEKFREATLAAPSYAPAWRGLGIAYERMNRNADALRAFRRYVRIAPGAADAPRIQARIEALE